MADEMENLPEGVERVISEEVGKPKKGQREPIYKMIGDSKIPVSKHMGKMWKGRKDAGWSATSDHRAAADEAIAYYHHDQMGHRAGRTPENAGNRGIARRMNGLMTETENVVFSNVNALIPALYAKNPESEFTSNKRDELERKRGHAIQKLINALLSRKAEPGVNFKIKAKRAVVLAQLTNAAWAEVGYITKDQGSEQALADLQEIAKKLEDKNLSSNEIERLEGELVALEEQIDVLRPSGPFLRIRQWNEVVVDPHSEEPDHCDANWMMISDMIQTNYLAAKYGRRKGTENADEYASIFEPSHVLLATEGQKEDLNNFKMFNNDEDHTKYGYADESAYSRARYTKVWMVWDKVTRRVYMFNDKDWQWPIWVWDDPYHLDGFFPLKKLAFHLSPTQPISKGEVTYYLDQQDAINEINDEERRARLWVKRNIAYNKNKMSQTDAENLLKGDDGTAVAVDLKEGEKWSDAIFSIAPPSMNFPQLFDTSKKLQAIDRITGLNEVLRGGQFKTNTTNKAIEQYTASTSTRLEDKVDSLEDWIGDVCWMLAQMCLQFMEADMVGALIGDEYANEWQNMSPDQIRQFSVICVGGSTQKPTSRAKKQEAVEVMQVLGQFAKVAPGAVLEVGLRMLEQAFDEITIQAEDWQMIRQSVAAGLGGGTGGAGGETDPTAATDQVDQMISQLSPQVRKALGLALAKGVPLKQALAQIDAMLKQQQGTAEGETNVE